ncbi:MAG: flagellar basal-body rod protein FlgC [Halioglobus sp.]|jgi:flagellar basal-body rod protein FlgC
MDYTALFEISGSGMDFQRLRLETIANNLANANTTRGVDGGMYKPLEAVARSGQQQFDSILKGIEDISVVEKNTPPRLVFNPAHPDADAEGYVAMPGINPVDEMLSMMLATRGYEANIRAMNAAKTMALRALEIGGSK